MGIKCFGHLLQLCVGDVKREVPGFSLLCAKARAIVGRARKAQRLGRALWKYKEKCSWMSSKLCKMNSKHEMMSRLLKLRKPITMELSECDGVDNLTMAEGKLMTAAVKMIDPLSQATTELYGDKYPTLS
ncbi:hypothetical protein HPB51_012903 [Rhipicephalus microplus]|uniref:Uncharacterized protein n=1 Tax=Rhipicephalus microplus TaxID=6941 RepID=A0A9J6EGM8_RHIMP|nr:hypothetical protein HPB51_012903 [Rhipicephalus microplus]